MSAVDRSRLPQPGVASAFQLPEVHKSRLDNGMAVWSAVHGALPVQSFVLAFPFGYAADFPGSEGLAAITADLLDEGSGHRSAIDINAAFASIGSHLDIDVSPDVTILSLTCLSRFGAQALALIADCVVRPALAAADFERVRQLRLARLIQIRDMASVVADRAFMQLAYGAHPYGHMALGTEDALRQISHEEVQAFHRKTFGPRGATLLSAGSLSASDVRAMAQQAFGSWTALAADPAPDAALTPPPPASAQRLALVDKASAAQSEIRLGEVGLSRDTPDYFPLIVLNMVLGGQFVSRINMKLRQEKGLTYGARTSFDFRRGRGPFVLQTSVQSDGTAEALQASFDEIEALQGARPPTADEVELAKAALTRGYARNFETTEQMARAMTQLLVYALPENYFETFSVKVGEVDTDLVRQAARSHLHPGELTAAIVGDAAMVGPQLVRAGLGEPIPLVPRL